MVSLSPHRFISILIFLLFSKSTTDTLFTALYASKNLIFPTGTLGLVLVDIRYGLGRISLIHIPGCIANVSTVDLSVLLQQFEEQSEWTVPRMPTTL